MSYKKVLLLLSILCLLVVVASAGATDGPARPDPASPEGETVEVIKMMTATSAMELTATTATGDPFQDGADRLAALQNDDGGWDWPLDDGNPANASPTNTIGPIAKGLAVAYLHTGDPSHLAALSDAGAFLLTKTNNFSPSDGYLAAQLDAIFGGTTYVDYVLANYYGPLADGTYKSYNTASYVEAIRTSREKSNIPNLAAWDIGMGLVGAASVGADIQPWIDGAKAEIEELDGSTYYDVIGLAGAVYGLAFVGEDFDPTAGEHATAESLSDLADILASYQIDGGGFTWNSAYTLPGNDDETIQETAYAALALNEVDRVAFQEAILGAVNYMVSVQLETGGWKNWAGGNENNEITGEALWAIGLQSPPVADANGPYVVPVGGVVTLDGTASSDPDGDALTFSWTLTTTDPPLITGSYGILAGETTAIPNFTAGGDTGIQYVNLVVSDGSLSAQDEAMIVVYDPSAGFVTGGGWVDSKPGDYKLPDFNVDQLVWDQGFEADTDGWYGLVSQVTSGESDISSASGAFHSVMEGDEGSGPYSRFDGYRDTWAGTWTAEIDVYLDPSWEMGTGFDYSVAANGTDGLHQRDYIFHVTKDTSTGKLLVAGSNNTNFAPREDLESINHFEVVIAGWYTLQHVFYESAGALAVDLNLLDSAGNVLFTETRFNAADVIPDEVGGNRYAWFTFINVNGGIAVDNHQLVFPIGPEGKASFGFVSKYTRGAVVPTGNTTFVFQNADLNFKSESYDWLLVTGGDYAKFKGDGTINDFSAPNGQPYKFMVWAGDGDAAGEPDTFRIKIWYEGGEGEVVVYDNGMDQEIGGGNIVVHSGKNKK